MPKHRVSMAAPSVEVGRSGVSFVVHSADAQLGELTVSNGGVRWRPSRHRAPIFVDWERLAELLGGTQVSDLASSPLSVSPTPDYYACPRCQLEALTYKPDEVDGVDWTVTHQCDECGMVAHHTVGESVVLASRNDLYRRLGLGDGYRFEDWLDDYSDGTCCVGENGDGDDLEILCYKSNFRVGINFPTNLRTVLGEIQSAEDAEREDWLRFTGEAARRLIPVSKCDGWGDWYVGEEKMPEGWVYEEEDDVWQPPPS